MGIALFGRELPVGISVVLSDDLLQGLPRVITLVFVNNIMRNCDGSDLSGDYFRKLKE